MGRNAVRAKLDIIFKRIFADDRNVDLLQSFLAGLLDLEENSIHNIQVQNPDILPDTIGKKYSRLDLKMKVDDKIVNVELQVRKQEEFNDRSLYYAAKLFSGELNESDEYSDLSPCISINIVNFNMFDCESFQSKFRLLETTRHEELSPKFTMIFFELKKINKKPNKDNLKELWLQFINAETEEELDMLNNTGVAPIQKAVMVLHEMSNDERIQEEARIREKAMHIEATELGHARRAGRAEERADMVAKMKSYGLSDEEIEKILNQ